ncbi:MAG: PorT family protein [Lentimicrobium sp.]|jgi:hypothetical protein|uniref:porin family protein n=2 Tax=Lentimicrobium sp. TaxID=2034841 RepID=UPI0025DA27DD|nr:porin family protein [Lentimicrobium sp.]MCO5257914.1 PorT family protein [Lentimicrobium sp.]MCO5264247.1 PorT family protein [Lentimicrobium sp.]HPF65746.1 porin family protein [Lentimicrobium sp.]HPJ63490.1 porin family protein [Lentimicrobium sp.]
MKKFISCALIAMAGFFTIQSQAQSFILKAGMSLPDFYVNEGEDVEMTADYKMRTGFHAGLSADFTLNKVLSFEPGIMFSSKGAKSSDNDAGYRRDVVVALYYLDIPLLLRAGTAISDGIHIYAAAGPYAGVGLSGKSKITSEFSGVEEYNEVDVEWGDAEEEIKRLEFGATFGAGLEIGSFFIGAGYDLGITDISNIPGDHDDFDFKNRVLRITAGYRF